MKNLLVLLFLIFSGYCFSQSTPKFDISVPSSTSLFGIGISVGVKVYDTTSHKIWKCQIATAGTFTLTTAPTDHFVDIGDYNNLTNKPTIPDTTKLVTKYNVVKKGLNSTYLGLNSGVFTGIDIENTGFGAYTFTQPQDTVGNGADMYGANTAIGAYALQYNTHGSMNTALGRAAMLNNTWGWRNSAVGYKALWGNTTGHENVAVGEHSLVNNTTGNYNTAIGTQSLNWSITQNYNTALGYNTLYTLRSGELNTAIGYQAGELMDTAGNVTYIGYNSGRNTKTNGANVGVGNRTLETNTTGHSNTAIGFESMQYNDIGTNNTALGRRSLYHYLGHYSVGVGTFALQASTSGWSNTAIGEESGYAVTIGADNVFVGRQAGVNVTSGSNNIIIGSGQTAPSATANYQLKIGDYLTGDLSNGNFTLGQVLGVGTGTLNVGKVTFRDSISGGINSKFKLGALSFGNYSNAQWQFDNPIYLPSFGINAGGDVNANYFQLRNGLKVLNKISTAFIPWAEIDVTGAESQINLKNLKNINDTSLSFTTTTGMRMLVWDTVGGLFRKAAIPAAGVNYWQRIGTVVSPLTSGDAVSADKFTGKDSISGGVNFQFKSGALSFQNYSNSLWQFNQGIYIPSAGINTNGDVVGNYLNIRNSYKYVNKVGNAFIPWAEIDATGAENQINLKNLKVIVDTSLFFTTITNKRLIVWDTTDGEFKKAAIPTMVTDAVLPLVISGHTISQPAATGSNDGYMTEGKVNDLTNALAHKTTEDALNGLVKVDGAGSYSAVTDNHSNWDKAYTWSNTASTKKINGVTFDGINDITVTDASAVHPNTSVTLTVTNASTSVNCTGNAATVTNGFYTTNLKTDSHRSTLATSAYNTVTANAVIDSIELLNLRKSTIRELFPPMFVDTSALVKSGKILIGYTVSGIVIDTLYFQLNRQAGTPSVTPTVHYGSDWTAAGTSVVTAPAAVTSYSTVIKISGATLNNPTINAGQQIWLTWALTVAPKELYVWIAGHYQ